MSTKTIQGKLWSVSPAFWSEHFEPWFLPMYRKALELLNVNGGHLLLDAGCGSGLFTSMAIRAGAQVTGVDAAQGLLEIAKRRNPHNNYLEEDLEALPFQKDSFHVVTGFNSFQFAGNVEAALLEAKRVLRPGGRLLIGIWDKPELSEASNVLTAIGAMLPPPPPGTPGPFAMSEDGKMEAQLQKIGMKVVSKTSVPCPFIYSSLEDAVKGFMGTGPAAAAMNIHDRQTVEETIAKAFQPYHITEGIYFLMNHFLVFVAEK